MATDLVPSQVCPKSDPLKCRIRLIRSWTAKVLKTAVRKMERIKLVFRPEAVFNSLILA